MKLAGGFYSDVHAARFMARAANVRRGGDHSRICGARTRSGGACQQPPLAGATRCLRHAGPHHARHHRQQQLQAFAEGRLSNEAFARVEARRAANALRNAWRRDPWTPGRTIDLGEHEARFLTESGLARQSAPVAPAVLDFMRWRYRRLQVDHRRDGEWARVVNEEYPRRVRDAGPPPAGHDPGACAVAKPVWTARTPATGSKRLRSDSTRVSSPEPAAQTIQPSPFDDTEVSESRLAQVAYEQRDVLAPLLSFCTGTREQRFLIRELAIYLDRPTDLAAVRSWTSLVSMLRARA